MESGRARTAGPGLDSNLVVELFETLVEVRVRAVASVGRGK